MGHGQRSEFHRQFQSLLRTGTNAGLSDGQLLERFIARNDEDAEWAFATLVERHGPTVLRVCQSVLRDTHSAEDAFQATFLVLANKARSIYRRNSVGSWLYGVALRVAAESRSAAARRRNHERRAAMLSAEPISDPEENELVRVVHEEVGRLPERLRAAIVLCSIEGRTCEEAAQQLGWPVGTVKTRLASGRLRLRSQLVRRGLAPAVGSGTFLATESVRAALPDALVRITARSATQVAGGQLLSRVVPAAIGTLVQGVIMGMFKRKLQTLAAATLVSLGTAVVACFGFLETGGTEDTPALTAKPTPEAQIAPLLGTWRWVSRNGEKVNGHLQMSITAIRGGSKVAEDLGFGGRIACTSTHGSDSKPSSLLYVDPDQDPPHVNFVPLASGASDSGRSAEGTPAIYHVEGDRLTIHQNRQTRCAAARGLQA